MTIADWALIISLGSVLISLFALVWNVWSKFIYPKPIVRVGFSQMRLVEEVHHQVPPVFAINATNHGPGEVVLFTAVARSGRRGEIGMLNPLLNYPYDMEGSGPFGGSILPKRLGVGDTYSVFFPVSPEWFTQKNLIDFGFNDTFGRLHWAPRKEVKRVRSRLLERED